MICECKKVLNNICKPIHKDFETISCSYEESVNPSVEEGWTCCSTYTQYSTVRLWKGMQLRRTNTEWHCKCMCANSYMKKSMYDMVPVVYEIKENKRNMHIIIYICRKKLRKSNTMKMLSYKRRHEEPQEMYLWITIGIVLSLGSIFIVHIL